MALFRVPITNDTELYQFVTSLDRTKLSLQIRYNSRNDCWYMTLIDQDNVTILESIPLLSRVIEMVQPYGILPVIMYGDFIVQDTQDSEKDCTLENFGGIVQLFYVNADL